MAVKCLNSLRTWQSRGHFKFTEDYYCVILKIYMQYSMHFKFACNNDLCSAVLTNLLGDVFLSFLLHLSYEYGGED